ncbi:MAG: glycosyltransferase family 4 protein [Gammaproteobacteria bacterium]|nr:glycosyltransferase family 4 protein [Gammaproteobacteria bacterium]MCW8909699.1 glycosyltransferase family 4 protein [Gammaproteobacteria bacterium]MCW9006251.1 glycosyltransferase family 4 protein [Gammaproteobacteria bacterium]MCW9055426.1 glycosyltransferase family 4 protein [Gammaproteobacteria bacterium]
MNVMHIMTGDLWAGAEVQLYETILNTPIEIRDEIIVVLFSQGELAKKLSDNKISINVIDEDECNSLSIIAQLVYYINIKEPSVIHVHDYKSHVIASIAIYKSLSNPVVVRTLHGLKVVPKTLKMLKSYALSIVENIVLRYKTDCIIAVSKDIEKILVKKYRSVRVEQISNAISIIEDKSEDYKIKIREKYNIEDDQLWIAATSRLVGIKNLKMLIDAIAKIKPYDINGFVVSIFGTGPLKNDLQKQIDDYNLANVIRMHGHVIDIVDVMPGFDVFVNTSIHEGMPMSVLEAMSCSVPPVCTSVGGMKEIIQNTHNGMLVELNDVDALADVFVLLKRNKKLRKLIGSAARARIINNYNITKSINKLNDVYESLLSH